MSLLLLTHSFSFFYEILPYGNGLEIDTFKTKPED